MDSDFQAFVPEDLLLELEERFQFRVPDLRKSDREIQRDFGKLELIQRLRLEYERQQNNILQRKTTNVSTQTKGS